jgi:hypothetical protein
VSNDHGNIALRKVAPPLLATLFLISCNPEISAAGSDLSGRDLFATNCAICHGPTGKGDGPAAPSLQTQAPDLTKIADRRDGVWPMLDVMAIIDGYTKRTNPRAGMPIIPALTEGPMVDFDPGNGIAVATSARLLALVNYLETIQSPQPERYVP